jgi:hypothetical protein
LEEQAFHDGSFLKNLNAKYVFKYQY